jgi:hypothetical protein
MRENPSLRRLAKLIAQATTPAIDTNTWILIAVAVVVVVALIAIAARRQRSQRLKQRFGPEYDRSVAATGSQARAEADLARRERHVRSLDLKPISPGARARYSESWRAIQSKFVDEPHAALAEADRLLTDAMRDRGYPVDTDQRFEDLSVDHAGVLANYRTATKVARDDARGNVGTEDLRRAMVAYRALFAELIGSDPVDTGDVTSPTANPRTGVRA